MDCLLPQHVKYMCGNELICHVNKGLGSQIPDIFSFYQYFHALYNQHHVA